MVHLNGRAWPKANFNSDITSSLPSALYDDLQSLNQRQDRGSSPRRSRSNVPTRGPRPLLPRSLKEALQLAELLSKSKLIPKGFETPETCLVGILYGMEVGLSPIAALQRMAVIDGRPTIWGDAALALVQASSLLQSIAEEIVEKGDPDNRKILTAICRVKREGRSEPTTGTFSIEDAKRAGLWEKPGPWTDYPKRMLTMRARAFALRDAFPDVLAGLYIREEFEGSDRRHDRQKDEHELPHIGRHQVHTRSHVEERGQDGDIGKTNISRDVNTHCNIITAIGSIRRAPPPPEFEIKDIAPAPEGLDHAQERFEDKPTSKSKNGDRQSEYLDAETLLDLFDSALCCAFDSSTLEEIMDEFVERLSPLSRETQERAQKIIARHKNRVDELDPNLELNKADPPHDGEQRFKEFGEDNKQQAAHGEVEIDLPRGLKALLPNLGLGGIQSFRRRKTLKRQSRSLTSWNARQRLQAFKLKTISPTDLEDREDSELEP